MNPVLIRNFVIFRDSGLPNGHVLRFWLISRFHRELIILVSCFLERRRMALASAVIDVKTPISCATRAKEAVLAPA